SLAPTARLRWAPDPHRRRPATVDGTMAAPLDPAAPAAPASPAELLDRARAGDRAALARLLSLVERGGPDARAVGRLTHPLGGQAYTVGITGAPGAGKSTLTGALVARLRAHDAS